MYADSKDLIKPHLQVFNDALELNPLSAKVVSFAAQFGLSNVSIKLYQTVLSGVQKNMKRSRKLCACIYGMKWNICENQYVKCLNVFHIPTTAKDV